MKINNQLRRMNVARDYIADRYFDPFSLSHAAKSANMSAYHFLRLFKFYYGETPNEFLIRLRIAKAKDMLITESMSVSEVCAGVGYISLGSFSSLFAKRVGMSPSLYRRKLWSLSSEAFCYPVTVIPACYAHHFLGK